jgi:hypothetical protein
MHASAYLSIHTGAEISVETTDPNEVAGIIQEMGEHLPKALVKSWWLGEFKLSGPWWYRISNLDSHGPVIGLWLVGQLCRRGWEVFQVNQGTVTTYHLRLTG